MAWRGQPLDHFCPLALASTQPFAASSSLSVGLYYLELQGMQRIKGCCKQKTLCTFKSA